MAQVRRRRGQIRPRLRFPPMSLRFVSGERATPHKRPSLMLRGRPHGCSQSRGRGDDYGGLPFPLPGSVKSFPLPLSWWEVAARAVVDMRSAKAGGVAAANRPHDLRNARRSSSALATSARSSWLIKRTLCIPSSWNANYSFTDLSTSFRHGESQDTRKAVDELADLMSRRALLWMRARNSDCSADP